MFYQKDHSYGGQPHINCCHVTVFYCSWTDTCQDVLPCSGKMNLLSRRTRVLHPSKSSGVLSVKHVPLQKSLASGPGRRALPPSASALMWGMQPFTRPCVWSLVCPWAKSWEVSNGLGPSPVWARIDNWPPLCLKSCFSLCQRKGSEKATELQEITRHFQANWRCYHISHESSALLLAEL